MVIYWKSSDRIQGRLESFAKVQNKMHYAIHGHTAAELIYERADADKTDIEEKRPDIENLKAGNIYAKNDR